MLDGMLVAAPISLRADLPSTHAHNHAYPTWRIHRHDNPRSRPTVATGWCVLDDGKLTDYGEIMSVTLAHEQEDENYIRHTD